MEKERQNLVEGKFGTGFIYEEPTEKTYVYMGLGAKPVDWELGRNFFKIMAFRAAVSTEVFNSYNLSNDDDYRRMLAYLREHSIQDWNKFEVFDQNGSSSCVAQATCKYQSFRNFLETGIWQDFSTKDLYPRIRIGNGGAYISSAFSQKNSIGIGLESMISSYPNGLPPTENWIKVAPELDHPQELSRYIAKGKEYRQVVHNNSIDKVAEAIRDNFGAVFGIWGENNGTWHSEYPQAPEPGHFVWGHGLFLPPHYGLNERGEKFIGFPNSWGKGVGVNGWQKLTESYFLSGNVQNIHIDTDEENAVEMQRPFEKVNKWWAENEQKLKAEAHAKGIYVGSVLHSYVWPKMQEALGLQAYTQRDFFDWGTMLGRAKVNN